MKGFCVYDGNDENGQISQIEEAACELIEGLNGSLRKSIDECAKQCKQTTSFMDSMRERVRVKKDVFTVKEDSMSGDGNGHD